MLAKFSGQDPEVERHRPSEVKKVDEKFRIYFFLAWSVVSRCRTHITY